MSEAPRPPSPVARIVDAALEATVVGSFSRVGCRVRSALFAWEDPAPAAGRTVVVTGATSGLGFAAARRLVALGAHVVMVGRDDERLEAARSKALAADDAGGTASCLRCDLGELTQVRALAARLLDEHGHLDVLVHNAGALLAERHETSEGREVTLASHVLGPFLLTSLVRPALTGGRVLTMSSGGMYTERLDVDRLEMDEASYRGSTAYARAKRAQVVLATRWAARAPEVWFAALHPGWADTPGVADSLPRFSRALGPLLRSPDEGADTLVWLATAPQPPGPSGSFWHDRRTRRSSWFGWTSTSEAEAEHLWRFCSEQVGVPLI